MSKAEQRRWESVFPFGVELYYDGSRPDAFSRWLNKCYQLPVKKNGHGTVRQFSVPVQLVATVADAWPHEIGSYLAK